MFVISLLFKCIVAHNFSNFYFLYKIICVSCGAHTFPFYLLVYDANMDLPHFLNYKNSCAVDSLLDLSFYCFEKHLEMGCPSIHGPLLKLLHDVNTQRKVENVCSRNLREPVWDWLCSNVQSFAIKGSTDPAIGDVFPHLVKTSYEEKLFGAVVNRSYECRVCSSVFTLPKKVLCPVLLMTDEIKSANHNIERAIHNSVARVMQTRPCSQCNLQSSVLKTVEVKYPDCLIVQVPVVSSQMIEMADTSTLIPEKLIDLTKIRDDTAIQKDAAKSKRPGDCFHVMPNIIIQNTLYLQNECFKLSAAVKCKKCHFSIAVKKDGSFFDIDGCSVYTKPVKSLSLLSGVKDGNVYHTNATDGYFIFVFIKENHSNDSENCDITPIEIGPPLVNTSEFETSHNQVNSNLKSCPTPAAGGITQPCLNDTTINLSANEKSELHGPKATYYDTSGENSSCKGSPRCDNENDGNMEANADVPIVNTSKCQASHIQVKSSPKVCPTPDHIAGGITPPCLNDTTFNLSANEKSELHGPKATYCDTSGENSSYKGSPRCDNENDGNMEANADVPIVNTSKCQASHIQVKSSPKVGPTPNHIARGIAQPCSNDIPTSDLFNPKSTPCDSFGEYSNYKGCVTSDDKRKFVVNANGSSSNHLHQVEDSMQEAMSQDGEASINIAVPNQSHIHPTESNLGAHAKLSSKYLSFSETFINFPFCQTQEQKIPDGQKCACNVHIEKLHGEEFYDLEIAKIFHLVHSKPFCDRSVFYEKVCLEMHCRRKRNIASFLATRNIDPNRNITSWPSPKVSAAVYLLYAFRNTHGSKDAQLQDKCRTLQNHICLFLGRYMKTTIQAMNSEDPCEFCLTNIDEICKTGSKVILKNSVPFFIANSVKSLFNIGKRNILWLAKSKIAQWGLKKEQEFLMDSKIYNAGTLISLKVVVLLALTVRKPGGDLSSFIQSVCDIFESCIVYYKNRSPVSVQTFWFPDIKKQTVQLLGRSVSSNHAEKLSYNKYVGQRLKVQKSALKSISEKIHGSGKENLKVAFQYDLQHESKGITSCNNEEIGWDGSLSAGDLLEILDGVPSKCKTKSILEEYYEMKGKPVMMNMSAEEIISLVDLHNGYDLIGQLRKKYPNCFPSSYEIKKMKNSLFKEYKVMMQPKYIPEHSNLKCGIKVNPSRLIQCLRYLYYYIPNVEWWKLWGDGREIGGRSSCLLTISNINNEQVVHNKDIHSPNEVWPLAIFYGDDHRWNLETNLGSGGQCTGWLDDFVKKEQDGSHESTKSSLFFLSGDSAFLDAIHGDIGEFSPLSISGFNLYIDYSRNTKGETDVVTGLRSDLKKSFNRTYPNAIVPSIPIERVVFCIDHASTRVVEKMIQLRLKSIAKVGVDIKPTNIGKQEMQRKLEKFKQNLLARGIRKVSRIEIASDGTLKERLTLNKSEAHTLLYQPEDFINVYPNILDGVASHDVLFQLDSVCQNVLNLTSKEISEYNLESLIWSHLCEGIMLLRRSDPKPADCNENTGPTRQFEWGLSQFEQRRLKTVFDIFHKLFILRYGASELTPYMIKLIDVTPLLLSRLPIPSLMRFSTEGGEHSHYTQSCFYYQHTQRGGGPKTHDPINSVLFWTYRRLRARILSYSNSTDEVQKQIAKQYKDWVKREMAACFLQKLIRGFLVRRKMRLEGGVSGLRKPERDIPIVNVVLVGRVPTQLGNKESLCAQLRACGIKVRNLDCTKLPSKSIPVSLVVVTKQSDCDSTNPSKLLLEAVSRKWPLVSYDFILECIKQKAPISVTPQFCLNVDKLKGHTNCRVSLTHQHFEKPGKVKPLTEVKRKRKALGDISNDNSAKMPKTFHRPQSGYAYFFAQNFSLVKGSLKEKHTALRKAWKDFSDEEVLHWKTLANMSFRNSCQSSHSESKTLL